MSVQALTWAFKQNLQPAGLKFILVALANYASEDLYCYPSQKTLGKMTGQTDRTVRAHLVTLENEGFIRRESRYRPDGGLKSDGYWLRMDPPEESSAGDYEIEETDSAPPGNILRSPRQETVDTPPEESSANTKERYTKEETREDTKGTLIPKDFLKVIDGMRHYTDALSMHDDIEQVLRQLGFACEREYKVADRGDGRVGAIDLVAVREDATLAIELDAVNPRQKSILKLQQVPGAVRVVLLREGNERFLDAPSGLDAVVTVGAIRYRDPEALAARVPNHPKGERAPSFSNGVRMTMEPDAVTALLRAGREAGKR